MPITFIGYPTTFEHENTVTMLQCFR